MTQPNYRLISPYIELIAPGESVTHRALSHRISNHTLRSDKRARQTIAALRKSEGVFRRVRL